MHGEFKFISLTPDEMRRLSSVADFRFRVAERGGHAISMSEYIATPTAMVINAAPGSLERR